MLGWLHDAILGDPQKCHELGSVTDDDKTGLYAGDKFCTDDEGRVVGRETGIGVANGEYTTKDGDPAELKSLGINHKQGAWIDEEGDTNRGFHVDGGLLDFAPEVFGTSADDGKPATRGGFELGLLEGSATAELDEGDGLDVGLGFNLGAFGLFGGAEGTETDEQARMAVSAGPSLGGRLHWGDDDADGHREYGFGFDAGFVSMDLQSEDPVRTALSAATLGIWDGDRDNAERTNMTQSVADTHDSLTDTLAGVEKTQGTRGGPKSFGEMGQAELTMHAMFNAGMNDATRARVLNARKQELGSLLFGGMFD